jgi:hypothetical protein
MTHTIRNYPILTQLTSGDSEPVLVADFQDCSTAPRLSRLLSGRSGGRPVYRIDPVGVLSHDQLYLPLEELAASCAEEFLSCGPAAGRVFIVGHCSASALSMRVAKLLEGSKNVTVILVQPAWPDEKHVWNRFAEFIANLGAADRACPDLDGDPAESVARMERALRDELTTIASSQGLDEAADAFTELLTWYRAWLAFLLACHNDLARHDGLPTARPSGALTVTALTGTASDAIVPGLAPADYRVVRMPVLDQEAPVTAELADFLQTLFTSR